ncbi:MAG TPA: threonine synthase [Ruminococcaceae bacterium]|nr:threonine synthase [Oscillospiraceae bacterium]
MKYISTRDSSVRVTASHAITQGISKDGGLFVPESFPSLHHQDFQEMISMNYADRAAFVMSGFLSDFTKDEIGECTKLAYCMDRFRVPAVAPLHELYEGVNLLELWHGPTCAFKDMALQILPQLMRVSAKKTAEGKTIIILVATSGDTGKAALEGFKDAANTRILVFYPEEGVSPMQKLQMVTQEGGNVAVCGIRGNFDDAQTGVKSIFTNPDIAKRLEANNMMFSSANSINWGRLLPQIVYYISSYCDLISNNSINPGDKINIVVPTGNFGNILAAYYAGKMGLPINRLICASNKNRVLTDFIQTGVYNRNREFHATSSPSMDILISSNLERLLYDLSECDDNEIIRLMQDLNTKGQYKVSDSMSKRIQSMFSAGWCDDLLTAKTIKDTFDCYGYLCDTHTAVAINVYEEYRKQTDDKTPTVIVSTANPYKFSDNVLQALGGNVKAEDEFNKMDMLYTITQCGIPDPLAAIKGKNKRFHNVCSPADMEQIVYEMLHIG